MQNLIKRAQRILEIAERMASSKGWKVSSVIEEINLHYHGYAEPGYHDYAGCVATGNWNEITEYDTTTKQSKVLSDLPKRIGDLFEKMGIACEWSDEWTTCDCGKLVRTQGDSYQWMPSYYMDVDNCELTCIDCLKTCPKNYLSMLEDNPDIANTISDIDPSKHGYIFYEDYDSVFGNKNNLPDKISYELRGKGITRYLFNIESSGQFNTKWSVYIHKDEVDLLEDEVEEDELTDEELDKNVEVFYNTSAEVEVTIMNTNDHPCKYCKTGLNYNESPCWRCGGEDPTK
jgi:hypothetical protein